MNEPEMRNLQEKIAACRLCAPCFAQTKTAHEPRPVVWFQHNARILVAGQAPGRRVHESGRPFTDRSGDRLREWLGLSELEFYNKRAIAIVPMAFCFPGYSAKGADLPPPAICRNTWHDHVMRALPHIVLRIVLGGAAQRYHLKSKDGVTKTVKEWHDDNSATFALPHPSWRNSGWLRQNPWFEAELLPALRARVRGVLDA